MQLIAPSVSLASCFLNIIVAIRFVVRTPLLADANFHLVGLEWSFLLFLSAHRQCGKRPRTWILRQLARAYFSPKVNNF